MQKLIYILLNNSTKEHIIVTDKAKRFCKDRRLKEGAFCMTEIREKTMKMLEKLPDDKMIYVFNILQNIEALAAEKDTSDMEERRNAFKTLMQYSGTLPAEFDYKAELEAARIEKYGSIN